MVLNDYQHYQSEDQSSFRAKRSSIDNIFCITQLLEKTTSVNRETRLVFIDLAKTYETVPINRLFEVLQQTNINATVVKALQELYKGAESQVKLGKNLNHTFKITRDLRQGCCMSPLLFNICLDTELLVSCNFMGIPFNNEMLFTLHNADDQVVIAQDHEDGEFMVKKLYQEYQKWGLEINLQKTEYLFVFGEGPELNIEAGSDKSMR